MTAQESGIIGYWFASEPVLPNGDGRAVVIGQMLAVNPPLEMCRRGLHGSEHPFDALQYATGPLLYRCRFSGEIIHGTDKLCASERTALAMLDFTPQLRLFARQVRRDNAEAAAEAARAKKSLRDAARAAARAVARAAAWGPPTGAATAAARAAARAIAWAAHWADASDASDARAARAARAVARDAFMQTVEDAFGQARPAVTGRV